LCGRVHALLSLGRFLFPLSLSEFSLFANVIDRPEAW